VSNEARHRDIAALLARGVIRVRRHPLAAKAIESHLPAEQLQQSDPSPETGSIQPNQENQNAIFPHHTLQLGGDQ
jgi:hypothetical protein